MKKHDFKKYPELTNRQMAEMPFESPHEQILEDFKAVVSKIIDGDTIRVLWEKRDFDFPIRLSYIAAPELHQRGGRESAKWLTSRIPTGTNIEILINPLNRVEKWGRLLGVIMHKGISINEDIINAGHALHWDNRKSEETFPVFSAEIQTIKNELTKQI